MLPPLDIGCPSKKETMGYKAAWKKELCKVALQERSRYKAAANLDWLGTHLVDPELRGDELSFAMLDEARMHNFVPSEKTLALAHSKGGIVPVKELYNFPLNLAAFVDTAGHLDKARFQHELPLLDRFPVVWAFWLQVYHTLTKLTGGEKRAICIYSTRLA